VGLCRRRPAILIELLGPEYSMEFSSLNTGLKVFLSREMTGGQGEDLVEKQNAEQGLMPVVENEPDIYGYIGTWSRRSATGAGRWRPSMTASPSPRC
jgi:hypothetical protein